MRATTSPSAEDREIAENLRRAREFVEAAMGIARKGAFDLRRRRVEQDIGHVLSAIDNVGTIAPRWSDPDLMSEDDHNAAHRKKLAD